MEWKNKSKRRDGKWINLELTMFSFHPRCRRQKKCFSRGPFNVTKNRDLKSIFITFSSLLLLLIGRKIRRTLNVNLLSFFWDEDRERLGWMGNNIINNLTKYEKSFASTRIKICFRSIGSLEGVANVSITKMALMKLLYIQNPGGKISAE